MPCPSVTKRPNDTTTPIRPAKTDRDRAEHDILEVHRARAFQPRHVHRRRDGDERIDVVQRNAAEHERDGEDSVIIRTEQPDQDQVQHEMKAALDAFAAEREDEAADQAGDVAHRYTRARSRAGRASAFAVRRARTIPWNWRAMAALRTSSRSARGRRRRSLSIPRASSRLRSAYSRARARRSVRRSSR